MQRKIRFGRRAGQDKDIVADPIGSGVQDSELRRRRLLNIAARQVQTREVERTAGCIETCVKVDVNAGRSRDARPCCAGWAGGP